VICTPSEVTKTISTGVPAGKDALGVQVKVTVAELLGGIAVVVVAVLLEGVIVVEPVEHIRVPFVNSSSAVAMETVGLPGGL
jgi:hypothetical protein